MKKSLHLSAMLLGLACILGLQPLQAQYEIGQTASPPSIDGVIDASWTSLASYVAVDPTTWTPSPDHQSLDDCSFTWTAVWDTDSLYLLIQVKDDTPTTGSQAEGSSAISWMNDNVELSIADPGGSGNNVFFRFGYGRDGEDLGLLDDPAKPTPLGSNYATADTEDGWLVEVAIPWANLSSDTVDFSGYPAIDKMLNTGIYVADLDNPDGANWDELSGHVQWPWGWGATDIKLVATATVDNTAPAAPANLASANVSYNAADVSWDASPDALGYLVLANDAPVKYIADPTATGTSLEGLAPETAFTISVLVSDGQNLSTASTTNFTTGSTPKALDLEVGYYDGAFPSPFEDFDFMDALGAQPMVYSYGDANVDDMDLAGNLKVTWTSDAFHMQVNVTDESLVNGKENPWENDNCEYHFDMGNERDGSATENAFDNYDADNFQYRAIPQVADQTGSTPAPDWTGVTMATYDYYGDGVDVIGYTIEMSWPWAALNASSGLTFAPAEDAAFAFDLKVSDTDADESSASITWSSFTHNEQYKNDAEYGQIILKGGPTGVDAGTFASGIQVFPNPSSGMTFLRFETSFSGSLQLYDVTGRVVLEKSLQNISSEFSLDLDSFSPGIYLISLEGEFGQKCLKKLILK